MKRILRVELWGEMSSTLTTEPMSCSDDRDPGRMMLYLGWIFLWLIAGGSIKGLNIPGRGFSLFLLTLWVLCSKVKVTDILWYMRKWYNYPEHFLSAVKMGVGDMIGLNRFELIPSIDGEPSYPCWVFSGCNWRGFTGGLAISNRKLPLLLVMLKTNGRELDLNFFPSQNGK